MELNVKMEVPPQFRELAERGVDRTENAITSLVELATRSVSMIPGPMTDVAKQALEITERNLKASLGHTRNLLQAKDIHEAMQRHSEFLRDQYGIATEQFKQMAGATLSMAKDAANGNSNSS
jgi:phasin